ncbi:DNA phosphorothioation-dependent restriction protein DptF [Anaerovibrio sp.]|uniref:DNA phosphorothioation-dependent restriction protein DptF n=1 Tax=Anaerovibrio sp. TaxID=1872532 RepID=UPI00388FC957
MGICKFVSALNRLRKSSSESIDNVEKFDDFKLYMHVPRTAEDDLRKILRKVNGSSKKSLILLCGSAGDGKSHLLSYLKNADSEKLLEGYTIFNDATESNSPSKTAIETLDELLTSFKDENLEEPGNNIILAINLGVLSNFVESQYEESYWNLKNYVEKNNILASKVNDTKDDAGGHFYYVSFSDYHMYSLTENGAKAGYIEKLLDKIFGNSDDNIFLKSYENNCVSCPLSTRCPVKKNYEFLMAGANRRFIAQLLIKAIIKDKVILTTREILNFVYDILVAQSFSFNQNQSLINDSSYLREFMKQVTPSLIFDSCDVTPLMNTIKKYDPLLIRSEQADEKAIAFYVSSHISNDICEVIKDTSYNSIFNNPVMLKIINDDKNLRAEFYNFFVRVNQVEKQLEEDAIYDEYIHNLYWFNAGKVKNLSKLYSMIEVAVNQWCGNDQESNLCLNSGYNGFSLYEEVNFNPYVEHVPQPEITDEIFRFVPTISVAFMDECNNTIMLDLDYSLFELIYKLNFGYIQTANDRNNHADFISFVNRMLQTGSLTKLLSIVSENGIKSNLSKGTFGYKFKVVK